MKLSKVNARVAANKRRFAPLRGKVLAAIAGGGALGFAYAGHALAQASSPSGGIGAQLNTISGEAINSGGTAFGMACYLAAAVCFGLGVWALWQRPPAAEPRDRPRRPGSRRPCVVRAVCDGRRVDQQGVDHRVGRERHNQHHAADGAIRHRRLILRGGERGAAAGLAGNGSHARRQVGSIGVCALAAMAIPLHSLSPGDALEALICPAGMGLIFIGTPWLGRPNRFNARLR